MFQVAILAAGLRIVKYSRLINQIVEDLHPVNRVGLVLIFKKVLILKFKDPVLVIVASQQVLDIGCVNYGSQEFVNSLFYLSLCLFQADSEEPGLCELPFALEKIVTGILLVYLELNYLLV